MQTISKINMKQFNQSIAWLSFYGITIIMAIAISGSIKPKPKEFPKIVKTEIDTMELVLNLIVEKEGASDKFIGDNGDSYGMYQIQENAIKDVNRRFKTHYRHKDAFSQKKAKEIAKLYLKLGREDYIRKRGEEPTINTYLRMWNGGVYNGYNSAKTLNY